MVAIQIARKFTKIEDLDNEIKVRRELCDEMVGQMWPLVMRSEIIELNQQREKILRTCESNKVYLLKSWNS